MVSPVIDRRLGLAGNNGAKQPVSVVATSNVTQSGEQTISSIALLASNAAGVPDRVLCTAQTDPIYNGVWEVQTGAWVRADDMNGTGDIVRGTQVRVARGLSAGTTWYMTSADPVVIGTSSQTWSQDPEASEANITYGAIISIIDGVLTQHATLAAAVSTVGSSRCAIVVRDDITMAANVTVPTTATLQIDNDAQITTTGFTLTINGRFRADPGPRFAGSGTVAFGAASQVQLRADWWPATASGLQAALTAAAGRAIHLSGSYALASTALSVPAGTWLSAHEFAGTWSGNVAGLTFVNGGGITGGTLTGAGNSAYNDSGRAIVCAGTNNSPSAPTFVTAPIVRDVTITEWSGYGVRFQYVNRGQVIGCNITEVGYTGVAILSSNDVTVEKNIIDGVTPGSGGGDAYGIFFDRMETGNETVEPRTYRTRVAYNVVKNVAVTAGNNGQGIDTHASVDAQIIGNMVDTCEVGIVLTASSVSGTQTLACQRANVVGNTIKGARVGYGILVSGAISGSTVNEYAQDISLVGNVIQGHGIAGDNLTGAIFCQGTKRLTVNGGSLKEPACYGINLGINNLGFNISGLSIIDPYDSTVTIPGAIHVNGNNNTGRFSDITCLYETAGLGTYVSKVSARIASGLTGLDISFGPMHFLGIASGIWDWSEATSTGINAEGVLRQRGSGTLSGGTLAVSFAKRFPVGLTPKVFIGQQTANICRAGTIAVTGFTATGTGSDTFDWEATT